MCLEDTMPSLCPPEFIDDFKKLQLIQPYYERFIDQWDTPEGAHLYIMYVINQYIGELLSMTYDELIMEGGYTNKYRLFVELLFNLEEIYDDKNLIKALDALVIVIFWSRFQMVAINGSIRPSSQLPLGYFTVYQTATRILRETGLFTHVI